MFEFFLYSLCPLLFADTIRVCMSILMPQRNCLVGGRILEDDLHFTFNVLILDIP